MADPLLDPLINDPDNTLLKKILRRLALLASPASTPTEVTLTVSDMEIGAVELKNGTDDTRATVFSRVNSNPVATQLVDSNGDPVSVGGGTQYAEDTPSAAGEQVMMAGVVRKDAPASLVDVDGDRTELQVNSVGSLRVDGSAVTQPISAASLPLPTGAATETTLAGVKTGTDKIPAFPATDRTTAAGPFAVELSDGAAFYKATTPFDTQPISAVSLPLPSGASQEHTTAASPSSFRLSDGAAFYDSTKTGQLPAALVGGRLDVVVGAALPTGSNTIGIVDQGVGGVSAWKVDGSAVTQPVSGTVNVNVKPATSGGFTTFHLVSAASTNATNIKASAGQVFGWFVFNSNILPRKLVFHNTAGTPVAGASVFFSIVIPGSAGANVFTETGIAFSAGIGITTVTGLADSDATAVASQDLIINIWYA